MKYFYELTEVENEIIRLNELRNLFVVVANGMDSSEKEQIESSIHHIEGSLEDICTTLADKFQQLWDTISTAKKAE